MIQRIMNLNLTATPLACRVNAGQRRVAGERRIRIKLSKINRDAPRSGAFPLEKLAGMKGLRAPPASVHSCVRSLAAPRLWPMQESYPTEQKNVNTRIVKL
jgi:hypothetical protein